MLYGLGNLDPSESSNNGDSATVRWFFLSLLSILVLIFFGRFLFTGRFFLLRDLVFDFFPHEQFYRSHLLAGVFPLWNPYTGGGEPFLSSIENAVFYPPNLLFLLFPVPNANVILSTLHVLLAAWGVWLACRTWRISHAGAVLAATAFAFSTQTVTRLEYFSFLCGFCWYPLVVALYCRWLRRGSLRRFFLVVFALCMQFMAGYPEAVLFSGLTLGLFGVFFGVVRWRMGEGWWGAIKPLAGLAAISALVFILCAVQVLPVLDILAYTQRDEMGPELGKSSYHPVMFLTTLFPYLFGTAGYAGRHWAPSSMEFWMTTCYVGVLPVILCLTALWQRLVVGRGAASGNNDDPISRFRTMTLCLVLIFFVLYAMGGYTPFFPYLYDVFPLIRFFRWPTKALMCVAFAVSCLAGIALDTLMMRGEERLSGTRRWLASRLPIVACLLAAFFMMVCLFNNGALGRWFQYRFFMPDWVKVEFPGRIPWALMVDQACIFIGMMLAAAVLFQGLFSTHRWIRGMIPWGMVIVVFLDLLLTTYPLLPSSDMDIMQNKGPYKGTIQALSPNTAFTRPPTAIFFYGIKNERIIRQARDAFAGSWAMVDHVHNAMPNSGFPLRNYWDLLSLYSSGKVPKRNQERLGKILGIGFWTDAVLTPGYFEDGDIIRPDFRKIRDIGSPAQVVGGIMVVPDRQELLLALIQEPWGRSTMALATEEVVPFIDPSLVGRAGRVRHLILRYEEGNNQLTIEVLSDEPGILVTTDTYYPGWEATVNGSEVPVFQADGAFRSVAIPAGRSVVEMEFRPRTLFPGLMISLAALALILSTVILANGRSRK